MTRSLEKFWISYNWEERDFVSCPRALHNDLARTQTQLSWLRVLHGNFWITASSCPVYRFEWLRLMADKPELSCHSSKKLAPSCWFMLKRWMWACPDCTRQLLSNFWRLEQLFAVLATSSNFCLSDNFWAKYWFGIHIKHEKVNDFVESFNSCKFIE